MTCLDLFSRAILHLSIASLLWWGLGTDRSAETLEWPALVAVAANVVLALATIVMALMEWWR